MYKVLIKLFYITLSWIERTFLDAKNKFKVVKKVM